MIRLLLRHFLTLIICIFAGSTIAQAQDLIARQAPIDRRIKAADSVSLNRAIQKGFLNNLEYNELYQSWNTSKVHCYASSGIPETFKIDLRGLRMPTPSRLITSKFGYRPTFRRMHKGLDIKVYTGDTIVAAFDGKVRIVGYEASGYGNYVVIRHHNGLETIYGHLSKSIAQEGEMVKAGQVIGLGGNTGRSYGSHLHFETRIVGVAIDPTLLFDFPNQDVTADHFVFNYRDCEGGVLTRVGHHTTSDNFAATTHTTGKDSKQELAQTNTSPRLSGSVYRVSAGETLTGIAGKLGLPVETLCSLNNLSHNASLQAGQILRY